MITISLTGRVSDLYESDDVVDGRRADAAACIDVVR